VPKPNASTTSPTQIFLICADDNPVLCGSARLLSTPPFDSPVRTLVITEPDLEPTLVSDNR